MADYPGLAWLVRYRERVNADPELKVIGDWFTTTFALTFGESRYALKVEKGRIVDIVAHPKLDVRALFGFRAPVDVWRKFLSAEPAAAVPRFLRHADAGARIRARGRRPRRDAERASAAPDDERDARDGSARC